MSKPSLQDVARTAGVGTSTVSRVLNNHPNISDRARQNVLAAVEALGYTPNLNARSFRLGQTHAVSVLLPVTGTPFYERLMTAIYVRLAEMDLDIAMFPLLGAQRIRRFRDPGALVYRADALLIASQNPDQLYGGRPPFAKPIVLVDAHHPGYHSVYFDNLAAGRMAAEVALSHRLPLVLLDHVAVPGDLDSPVFVDRRAGVMQVLGRHGVTPTITLHSSIKGQAMREAAAALLAQRPAGPFFVLAFSDELALSLQQHLKVAGLHAGQDYLLLGFDGSSDAAEAEISSVAQPVEKVGTTAANVLIEAMQGTLQTMMRQVFPPTLHESSSTTLCAKNRT